MSWLARPLPSHGKPVARVVPYDPTEEARTEARANLLQRLNRQPIINIGPWRRDEFYER
jgi:antitoxin (DNA-binding transcriptional repressor) of toxin-antitoxin stability system